MKKGAGVCTRPSTNPASTAPEREFRPGATVTCWLIGQLATLRMKTSGSPTGTSFNVSWIVRVSGLPGTIVK